MKFAKLTRRTLVPGMAAAMALGSTGGTRQGPAQARLVVVGGGFAGATAARFLRKFLPEASVTLVERSASYHACPFSNLVIAGLRQIEAQRFGYAELAREGIQVIHDEVTDIDPSGHSLSLGAGGRLDYDRLVLAPGIDFRWGDIEGYDAAAAEIFPHAWKAGPQTSLLRHQLEAMEDGGQVIISIPEAPFRCPPGPYERASLIAHYLKTHKPRARLLLLDAQDTFSKQPLFEEAWASLYPGLVERRTASDLARVVAVDPAAGLVRTEFDEFRADVANIIPPQKAGRIAERAGVTDSTGWCPVDAVSFESQLQRDIHVIGDAIISAPMPKSAFAANLQAKVCALQIARILSGSDAQATLLVNTCYSMVAEEAAVSITGVYSNAGGRLSSVEGAGAMSPTGAGPGLRTREAGQAEAWLQAITGETFG